MTHEELKALAMRTLLGVGGYEIDALAIGYLGLSAQLEEAQATLVKSTQNTTRVLAQLAERDTLIAEYDEEYRARRRRQARGYE